MAWVLIFGLGYNWSFSVPGIATEAECKRLGAEMQKQWSLGAPPFQCLSYIAKQS